MVLGLNELDIRFYVAMYLWVFADFAKIFF